MPRKVVVNADDMVKGRVADSLQPSGRFLGHGGDGSGPAGLGRGGGCPSEDILQRVTLLQGVLYDIVPFLLEVLVFPGIYTSFLVIVGKLVIPFLKPLCRRLSTGLS